MSTTFASVRTDFLTLLTRRDCTNAMADAFLQRAIRRIQRIPRLPIQEASVVITVSDGTYLTNGYLPIPSDYLKIKDITHTDASAIDTVLRRASLQEVLEAVNFGVQGLVRKYVRQGGTFVLGPIPKEGDTIRLDYYSEYTAVSADADTSVLLDVAEDAVLYGALSYAGDRWNDKRTPMWETRFLSTISELQTQADDDELSGDAVVGQAFYYPRDDV